MEEYEFVIKKLKENRSLKIIFEINEIKFDIEWRSDVSKDTFDS